MSEFPKELDSEDLSLCMMEWELTGYEVEVSEEEVIVMKPMKQGGVVYGGFLTQREPTPPTASKNGGTHPAGTWRPYWVHATYVLKGNKWTRIDALDEDGFHVQEKWETIEDISEDTG